MTFTHLCGIESKELLPFYNLGKLKLDKSIGRGQEIHATMKIGKCTNSQAVGRMKLEFQEFRTGFLHVRELEKVCGGEEDLNGLFRNAYLSGVDVSAVVAAMHF
jgi:hypothetical protein